MNEHTEKLIRELAEKFGTTAEHLWGVLVTQAAITGFTSAILNIVALGFLVFSVRFLGHKWIEVSKDGYDQNNGWCKDTVGYGAFIVLVLALSWALLFLHGAGDVAGRIINPEYWALKQIIR